LKQNKGQTREFIDCIYRERTAQNMEETPKQQTPIEGEATQTLEGTPTEGPVVNQTATPEIEPQAEVDYKKKFSDSAREVQRLLEKDKQDQAKLQELEAQLANKANEVSSEKLAEAYPDWDLMTDNEKWMAKELITLKEKSKWEEDLTRAKKSFPVLGEKEAEFKNYAYKYPKAIDIEVLAKSFLFDNKPETPVQTQVEPPKKGLEKPTGGSRQAPSPGLTLEDIKRLRETQPKLYTKMIIEGKLPKKLPER
jgi:hypothetical protein